MQQGEELALVAGGGRGEPYLAAQPVADRFPLAGAQRLVHLRRGGPVMPGAVGRADPVQPVALLQVPAGGLRMPPVVVPTHRPAVLTDQGGNDVNVVRAVPHGDPPHRPRVAVRRQSHLGHHLTRDVRPLRV